MSMLGLMLVVLLLVVVVLGLRSGKMKPSALELVASGVRGKVPSLESDEVRDEDVLGVEDEDSDES